MNKPQVDEYRLDIVDRLARIESTMQSIHKEARDTKLEIQMQNGRVRKLEGGMAAIQGIGSVVSIVFGGFFYLAGIMVAGGATFIGLKYKKLVDEIKEVFKVLQEAYEDGKLDNDERKKIMKEVLDVLGALMKIAWK